ncbi:hypothetical protein PoB_000429700 [Plakobranchus ocellatus]|uniref:Uncharacterized protein n=1 Tax=Plakobranchus ocellatus TaxID=259542 RepID=A0AAV3Y4Y4_9GAST|nr:hypothetical protein PoB_000429700 [Plakobranchus ocellatus]
MVSGDGHEQKAGLSLLNSTRRRYRHQSCQAWVKIQTMLIVGRMGWREGELEGERRKRREGEGAYEPVRNKKVISGFQPLRQARASVAGLEAATEGSLQISGRTR